jgi:DNA-directed RNA polymerase beta' subunit
MGLHGFTFGVEDVMPTAEIKAAKAKAMNSANEKCAKLIALYKAGTLERVPGCDLELSLEQMIGQFTFTRTNDGSVHMRVRAGPREVRDVTLAPCPPV